MHYALDYSNAAYAVCVQCFKCNKMYPLAHMVMDLDGPAFKAYYCKACKPGDAPKCSRSGCTICGNP